MNLNGFIMTNDVPIRRGFFFGMFAVMAAWEILAQNGFADVHVARMGMTAWNEQAYEIEH